MQKITSYIIALLIAAAFYLSVALTPKVDANETSDRSDKQNRWEYCSVVIESGRTESMGRVTAIATIHYARTTGTIIEKVEQTGPDNNRLDTDLFGKAFAKLGEQGWEMVTLGAMPKTMGGEQQRIYFKRQQSN